MSTQVIQAQALKKKSQTLISEAQRKEQKLDSYISSESAKKASFQVKKSQREMAKVYKANEQKLLSEYEEKNTQLEETFAEKETKLQKFLLSAGILLLLVSMGLGFGAHIGRASWQAHKITRLERKLEKSEKQASAQAKQLDKLTAPTKEVLQNRVDALEQMSYFIKDPVIGQQAQGAVKKVVTKKEVRKLRSQLEKSYQKGKIGLWDRSTLRGRLQNIEDSIS